MRRRTRREQWIDGIVVVVLAAGSVPALWLGSLSTGVHVAEPIGPPEPVPFLVYVAAACGSLWWRRTHALRTLTVALVAFSVAKLWPLPTAPTDLALLVAVYSTVVHLPGDRRIVWPALLGAATATGAVTVLALHSLPVLLRAAATVSAVLAVVVAPTLVGLWVRQLRSRAEPNPSSPRPAPAGQSPSGQSAGQAGAGDLAPRLARLTERERAVLDLIAEGCTNAQIGHELGIGLETVKSHVTRVLHKLGADHRTHAAVLLLRHQGSRSAVASRAKAPERR